MFNQKIMNYIQMPIIPEWNMERFVFCHPDDKSRVKRLIISDDIKLITSNYLNIGHCVITNDIIIETNFQFGYDMDDIMKGKFSCVAQQVFK